MGVRFPLKQPERLKKWLHVTQRDDWIPTANSYLCSQHFKEDCFDRTGQTIRIKEGAIPTIVLFPRDEKKCFHLLPNEPCKRKAGDRFVCGRPENLGRSERASLNTERVSQKCPPLSPNATSDVLPPHLDSIKNKVENTPHAEPSTARDPPALAPPQEDLHPAETVESQPSALLVRFSHVPQVEPKPPLPVDHLYAVNDSPAHLKRRYNVVTDKLEGCRKKLKVEKQKVRRSQRDVGKLKTMVKALRMETAHPPSCTEMVEENFSGVPRELLKRMLGQTRGPLEYAEDLKAFAIKLRLLSPKAYDYVRSNLKVALPHPNMVRSWQAHAKGSADSDAATQPEAPAEEEEEVRKNMHARTVIQQCQYARLKIRLEDGNPFADWVEIHKGMVVYICFFKGATEKLVTKMVKALLNVKLFEVEPGKQVSVLELPGSVLVIPQDTLAGKARRRNIHYPNNVDSGKGVRLYASFVTQLESQLTSSSKSVEAGMVVRYGVYGERQALVMDSDGLSTHIMEF
ncbi:hypothetical protein AAFF_G00411880 [Aldrovandia affinis]|uniref:D-aminoacyl-tRNA deacylase n=1 Tax=Aldrovandia affinis TaxID=143900 RepID=A0AAD7WJM6_9TELE|nr:hypothetical protein AAFF_G00411880 [Aldrovandia affinis]